MRSSRSSPGKSAVLLAARALRNRGMDENSVSSGEMEDAMELEESLAGGRMTPIPSRDCPSSSKTRAPRFRQGESKENEDTDSESEGDATSRRQGGRAPTMNANYHSDEDEEATEDNGNRYDPKLSPAKLQENINQSVPDPVSSEAKGQVAEVTESETPTEDGSVITAQDTEQAAGDDTANSTSSQEESNDKTTSEKGKHSSPLPKKVVKPPEGLTTGQLMTWHARQAKMRNTQMKKMEAQTGSGQKGPTRQKQVSRKQTTKLQGSNASLGANNNTNNEIGDSRLKQSHSASLQAARTRPKTKTTVKPLPPEELILEKLRTMGPQSLSQKELIGLPARDLEVGERVYTEFPNGEVRAGNTTFSCGIYTPANILNLIITHYVSCQSFFRNIGIGA